MADAYGSGPYGGDFVQVQVLFPAPTIIGVLTVINLHLQQPLELYNKYAEEQIKEAFGGYHDWSVFENEHTPTGLTCGKLTGTTVLFKACAELQPIDSCA